MLNLVRKIKHRLVNNIHQSEQNVNVNLSDKLHHNIETAVMSEESLYVRGWIYCEGYFVENVCLTLKGDDGSTQSFIVPLQRREDVKCVMGPKLYGNCGIECMTRITMDKSVTYTLQISICVIGQTLIAESDYPVQVVSNPASDVPQLEDKLLDFDVDEEKLPLEYMKACVGCPKTTDAYNIAILGNEWDDKSQSKLKKIIKKIRGKYDNVCIYRVGNVMFREEGVVQLGDYYREILPALMLEKDIDIVLTPNCMDVPIFIDADISKIKKMAFFIDYYSYAARYRVEHLREQLQWNGIASDYYMLHETTGVNLSVYQAIVVYRCSDYEQIENLVNRAKECGVATYYDVDDYVFEYDEISQLDFMKDPEYRDFKMKADTMKKCLSLFDSIIVSTEQLKKGVLQSFPQKRVVVNRNGASMEMRLWSEKALQNKKLAEDKFIIGYFSGSGTHNRDFALVAPVLAKIMQQYKQVELLIAGCMELPAELEGLDKRIRRIDFMDWRRLPQYIANVHLNIQPLQDTFFHSCKSENKWMEAALVATPTIASKNDELERVIRHDIDGVLCDSELQWKKAIVRFVERPEEAVAIGEQAYKRVIQEYMVVERELKIF